MASTLLSAAPIGTAPTAAGPSAPAAQTRFLAVDGLANQLGAESLIVEGAGHHPHAEMPDLVMPRLLSFIGGVHDRGSNHA